MTNDHTPRGILCVTRVVITTATITVRLLDLRTEATKTTPTIPYHKLLWRHPFPRVWRNLPHLKEYDGIADPVNHVDGFEVMLHYHNIGGPIKCRLFPTTLRKATMDCYKSLSLGSITS